MSPAQATLSAIDFGGRLRGEAVATEFAPHIFGFAILQVDTAKVEFRRQFSGCVLGGDG